VSAWCSALGVIAESVADRTLTLPTDNDEWLERINGLGDWAISIGCGTMVVAKTADMRLHTGRFRSVIDPIRVTAYPEDLLRRMPSPTLILVRRPAPLELLLKGTERLFSRAANGADQSDAVLD
jgi:hypothetical protein